MLGLGALDTEWNDAAEPMFYVGLAIQLPLGLLLMVRWITKTVQIKMCNPACLIGPVGILLVGLAFARIHVTEIAYLCYSASLFWWIMIFAQFLHRLLFIGLLPAKLIPMFFILLAPPMIATACTYELFGDTPMVYVFYSIGLFFALLLVWMTPLFVKALKHFELTWLAFVFPCASFAIGSMEVYGLTDSMFYGVIAWFGLGLSQLVFAGVSIATLVNVIRGKVFLPE
ncbi:hypothetical protein GEMRC1_011610 [Eukaryota sp. GEM-RC1]